MFCTAWLAAQSNTDRYRHLSPFSGRVQQSTTLIIDTFPLSLGESNSPLHWSLQTASPSLWESPKAHYSTLIITDSFPLSLGGSKSPLQYTDHYRQLSPLFGRVQKPTTVHWSLQTAFPSLWEGPTAHYTDHYRHHALTCSTSAEGTGDNAAMEEAKGTYLLYQNSKCAAMQQAKGTNTLYLSWRNRW